MHLAEQFQLIRDALALCPDSKAREAALASLQTIFATGEVMGARILQLNNMIPLDERGQPATQEYVDALLKRLERRALRAKKTSH